MYELGGPENLPHPDDTPDTTTDPYDDATPYTGSTFEDGTAYLTNEASEGEADEYTDELPDTTVEDTDAWLQPADDEYTEPDPRLVQLHRELSQRRPLTEIFEEDLTGGALGHMALLPSGEVNNNENIFVRSFPGPTHIEPVRTAAESEQLIDDMRTHLKTLGVLVGQPGVAIPNTYYQVREHPDGTATIDNITERVDGRPLIDPTTYRPEDDVQQRAALTVATALTGYFTWVHHEQPTFMADLTNLGQYLLAEDGTPTLIDTDPVMRPTAFIPNDFGGGSDALEWSIARLQAEILSVLPPSAEANALRQQVQALLGERKAIRDAHYQRYVRNQQESTDTAESLVSAEEGSDAPEAPEENPFWPPAETEYAEPDPRLAGLYNASPITNVFDDIRDREALAYDSADPLDHLGILPGNDNVIIRTFPAPHHIGNEYATLGEALPTPTEAHKMILDTQEHHAVLARMLPEGEIVIPNTYYTVRERPDGLAEIVNITERINAQHLATKRPYTEPLPPEQHDIALRQAAAVLNYHTWVLDTRPDVFLRDLGKADTFMHDDQGHIILVDTDPFTVSLAEGEGWDTLDDDVMDVKWWLRSITPSPERDRLLELTETFSRRWDEIDKPRYGHQ